MSNKNFIIYGQSDWKRDMFTGFQLDIEKDRLFIDWEKKKVILEKNWYENKALKS